MILIIVLDEAEPTRRLGVAVQTHDDALDGSDDAEGLQQLRLSGVER